jgi:FMN phosphatase YigB (HAD superfamily)
VFSAVLFDWRGTLFHDGSDADWIGASAASIGRELSEAEATVLARALGNVADDPRVIAARQRADCSLELHRAATLLELGLAGFDDELALAVWSRDGDLTASVPYPDAPGVLRTLQARGVPVGVISDIHYDLRPHFVHHGLADFVDTFTLSFEHGCQKPDPRLFELALASLGVQPADTLMVGDRASRDGGAVGVGVTTLILASVPPFTPRGLDMVLHLAGGHVH